MNKILNKILIKIAFIALLFHVSACEKEIIGYEGVEGVYFSVQSGASYGNLNSWPYQPRTNVEFVNLPDNEYVVQIKVMVTGPKKNYDRPFLVEINPEETSAVLGTHFNAIPRELIIPADSLSAFVPVTVKRTPDLKDEQKSIGLRLVANEHFELSFPEWDAIPALTATSEPVPQKMDASLHKINLNDFMVRPKVWSGSVAADNRETGTWGAFSRKKIELMCELMDLTYADFASTATMPNILVALITAEMTRYLIEMFDAGTPVLEDDGRLMYVGTVPWTSYIGVPF